MGIFSKIVSAFMNPTMTQGIAQSYERFLNAPSEFNPEVLSCSDVNYSMDHVRSFFENYEAGFSDEGVQNHVHVFYIEFEGALYLCHMFMHYARALSVTMEVEVDEHDPLRLFEFCNDVNANDLVHQVGFLYIPTTQKYVLHVTRQFLLTPNIGSADEFANLLRLLREFADGLQDLQCDVNAWKKYATVEPRSQVETAEDFWFAHPSDSASVLAEFVKDVKVLAADGERMVHSMIAPLAHTSICDTDKLFMNGSMTTYKDYPYLMSMVVEIPEGDACMPAFDRTTAIEACSAWNSMVHFAPSRAIISTNGKGQNVVKLVMTGWFAEEVNTRTFSDFLCTMQKTVMKLCYDLRPQ